jgi:uncharacterized protein YbbK (DUF523 family)
MQKPKYLVSACLIGKKCRYDGKDQARDFLVKSYEAGEVIAVCPEELGGLPTPRPPAEIIQDKVLTNQNKDVTSMYQEGAQNAFEIALNNPSIEKAYLKSKSPMCGCGKIYDGSFTGKLTEGDGVFTCLIKSKTKIPIESVD